MYGREVTIAINEFRDNIARYINDTREHFNHTYYDNEEVTQRNRKTITCFDRLINDSKYSTLRIQQKRYWELSKRN